MAFFPEKITAVLGPPSTIIHLSVHFPDDYIHMYMHVAGHIILGNNLYYWTAASDFLNWDVFEVNNTSLDLPSNILQIWLKPATVKEKEYNPDEYIKFMEANCWKEGHAGLIDNFNQ